jgi:hypothetical protein
MKDAVTQRVAIAIGLIWMAALVWVQRDWVLRGENDFAQFYAGGTLAASGSLYDLDAYFRVHEKELGARGVGVHGFVRPPFYSLLFKPLAMLPYRTAYFLFVAIQAAALLWFLRRFVAGSAQLAVIASLYPPLLFSLIGGQDVALLLALAAAGYLLLERERPFAAGLVWSLCCIKAHLFPFLVLFLLVRRFWRALAGGAAGGLVLFLLCWPAAGSGWVPKYLALISSPQVHPSLEKMPSLQALRQAIDPSASIAWIAGGALLIAVLVVWIAWRHDDWRIGFAASLAAGLAAAAHSYMHDLLLLLLALAVLLRCVSNPRIRAVAALAVSPLPPLLVLLGPPYSAVQPALLLALLVTLAVSSASAPALPARPARTLASSPSRQPDPASP